MEVTDDEIRGVMREIIMPVFEPGKSNVIVTCAPIMEEVSILAHCSSGGKRQANIISLQNIVKALSAVGYKTQVHQLSDFYDDYGLKADEDGEEDSEEEEDEEMEDGSSYTSGSDEDSD